jgi:hypothetical protein
MGERTMAKLTRKELRRLEERVLNALVDFFYESGYTSEAYRDPETGGIYEHKLAAKMGYELVNSRPPHELIIAASVLEAEGYVRRIVRRDDFPVMGIWPTPKGLDRHEYLKGGPIGRLLSHLRSNWPTIAVSFATTVVTLILSEAAKRYFSN